MTMTMAEARTRRNAAAAQDQSCGLNDYGSVGEAQAALENSGIRLAALDHADLTDMAKWMWRNDASPEDAAIAFGLKLASDFG